MKTVKQIIDEIDAPLKSDKFQIFADRWNDGKYESAKNLYYGNGPKEETLILMNLFQSKDAARMEATLDCGE